MAYYPRLLDEYLKIKLDSAAAVLIEGPRFSGKTETAKVHANSFIELDGDIASNSPKLEDLLVGLEPRLLDEWQVVPKIWNQVRRSVDQNSNPGRFILTGSATPEPDSNRHLGAGRIERLKMRTMSLFETGYSDGSVSLEALFSDQQSPTKTVEFKMTSLLREICVGGWPALRNLSIEAAQSRLISYIKDTASDDYSVLDKNIRNTSQLTRLIQSIARNTGSDKNLKLFGADMSPGSAADDATVASYFEILERLHLVDLVPGSSWHLRSRVSMRSKPRVYLTDPSLAAAAMGASPNKLLADLETLGFLYENLVMRDLITYLSPTDARVEYYRDSSDLEVDAILRLWNGDWAAIEIKLGQGGIEKAARSLNQLKSKLDPNKNPAPKFMAVVTNSEFSYRREDGIWVVSLAQLGP
jgi:predicted AAA+ superfamily ATPase